MTDVTPQAPTAGLAVRLVTPADRDLVRAMHGRCSAQSLRWRCLQPVPLDPAIPERLVDWMFDPRLGDTLAAIHPAGHDIVGLGHLAVRDAAGRATIAFLVEDAWQEQGLGRRLHDLVCERAKRLGYVALHADVAWDNERMLRILRGRGWALAPVDGAFHGSLMLS